MPNMWSDDMRLITLFFLLVIYAIPTHASCSVRSEESVKESIEKAYYIGLVKRVYYKEWSSGTFKEAGLRPFMVYKANPEVDLQDIIVITHPHIRTSCDIYPSQGIDEVLIMEVEGRLDMVRLGHVNYNGSLEELRRKARYVGE